MSTPPDSQTPGKGKGESEAQGAPVDDKEASRRRFMKAGIGVLGAGCACAVAVPALGMVGFPLGNEVTSKLDGYLPAGNASKFGEEPVRVELYADRVDAWNRVLQVKIGSAWVAKRGEKLVALSSVCPHLGCAVDWDQGAGAYKCPCHTSSFSPDGAHTEGPAPRGLDSLEVKQEDGLVQIRYQRFKQGIDAKESV